jgi:hypothetical protein
MTTPNNPEVPDLGQCAARCAESIAAVGRAITVALRPALLVLGEAMRRLQDDPAFRASLEAIAERDDEKVTPFDPADLGPLERPIQVAFDAEGEIPHPVIAAAGRADICITSPVKPVMDDTLPRFVDTCEKTLINSAWISGAHAFWCDRRITCLIPAS